MSNCTYPPCYVATTIDGVDNNHPSHFRSDTIAIIAFLVVAVICILCVYVGSSFVHSRRCCCPNWFVSPAPVADHNVDQDQGPIARKAGLFGLNRHERRLILEHILTGVPYGSEWETSSDEKRLAMKIDDNSAKPTAESSLLTSEDLASGTGSAIEYTMDAKFVDIILEVGQRHNTTVCSICLNEYDPVDLVVSGTSCTHCFHKACIFAWLDKHDHCPYCREEMITPVQMKVAAKKVLSVERMAQLGPQKKTRESSLAPAAVLVDDVEAQAAMG